MKTFKDSVLGLMAAVLSGFFIFSILSFGLAEGLISTPPTRTVQPTLIAPNLTPILVIQVSTTPFPTATFPPAPTQCPPPSGWQPYLVQPGDSLAGLAGRHGITLELLMTENCLISSQIVADTLIYLPFITATVTQLPPTPQPTLSSTVVSCDPPAGWIRYTVKSGDTLTRISMLYRISLQELIRANCLLSNNIRVGMMLWVPNVATSTLTASPTYTATEVQPTHKPTSTLTFTPTDTQIPTSTNTPEPPTPTATETPQPPTPTPTNTPETPTATLTQTNTLETMVK